MKKCKKSIFIIEQIQKYRKCPALIKVLKIRNDTDWKAQAQGMTESEMMNLHFHLCFGFPIWTSTKSVQSVKSLDKEVFCIPESSRHLQSWKRKCPAPALTTVHGMLKS